MTKTFKERKEEKDLHENWKASREGKRPTTKERGGMRNLLKELEEDKEEEEQ